MKGPWFWIRVYDENKQPQTFQHEIHLKGISFTGPVARQPQATWFCCTVICLRGNSGSLCDLAIEIHETCRGIAIFPLSSLGTALHSTEPLDCPFKLFRLDPFKASKSYRLLQKAPDRHHQSALACIASIRLGRNHVFRGGGWETSDLWSSRGYQFGFSSVNLGAEGSDNLIDLS